MNSSSQNKNNPAKELLLSSSVPQGKSTGQLQISDLQELSIWVNWREEMRGDKPTKVPYQPNGEPAKTNNVFTWSSYETTVEAAKNPKNSFDGVGYVVSKSLSILGCDLDECLRNGIITDKAFAEFVQRANSYTEVTPSDSGLRVLLYIPKGLELTAHSHTFNDAGLKFEVYNDVRYFTYTGRMYEDCNTIREITPEEVWELLSIVGYPWGKLTTHTFKLPPAMQRAEIADTRLLEIMFSAKNGDAVKRLYDGGIARYKGDDSAADAALCLHLAFWTRKDAEWMRRIWLSSPLGQRDKAQQRKDYQDLTIQNAIAQCREVYTPNPEVEPLSEKTIDTVKTSPEELEKKWKPYHKTEGAFIKTLQEEMQRLYAGKTLPLERNYIALISRHTAKPICKMDVSQSSAGKTKAADTALLFVSKDGYHKVDSSSPTAIVYNEEQYEHRMIVFGEIDSMPEEGAMASALRALISEGELVHEVTERGENGKFIVRVIRKKGPTGFLSTSTRTPKTQLATRTLVSGIDDSKEQTREVMRRIAQDFNEGAVEPTTEPFVAYDEWLNGNRLAVVIPFSRALAELLPADLVRMRRDITQLYRVIETTTLINQPHRDRDDKGRLVATMNDYDYARYLLADLFEDIVRGGITPQVRRAVETVQRLYYENGQSVTTAQVGEVMKIDRATATYHCKKAIESEYIENESLKGKPYKMKPGQPLPEDTSVLPTIEELSRYISDLTTQQLNTSAKENVEISTVGPLSGNLGGKETTLAGIDNKTGNDTLPLKPECLHDFYSISSDPNELMCTRCGTVPGLQVSLT